MEFNSHRYNSLPFGSRFVDRGCSPFFSLPSPMWDYNSRPGTARGNDSFHFENLKVPDDMCHVLPTDLCPTSHIADPTDNCKYWNTLRCEYKMLGMQGCIRYVIPPFRSLMWGLWKILGVRGWIDITLKYVWGVNEYFWIQMGNLRMSFLMRLWKSSLAISCSLLNYLSMWPLLSSAILPVPLYRVLAMYPRCFSSKQIETTFPLVQWTALGFASM